MSTISGKPTSELLQAMQLPARAGSPRIKPPATTTVAAALYGRPRLGLDLTSAAKRLAQPQHLTSKRS